MNKELEEAIQICNEIIKENKRTIKILQGTLRSKTEEEYLQEQINAMKTILNHIENSISKEVIEEKIEEFKIIANKVDMIPTTVKEERIDGSFVYSQRFNADGYIAQAIIKVLQELLEGK